MSTEKKAADYAFPSVLNIHGIGRIEQTGMTLRDWFAGQAMNGMYSHDNFHCFKLDQMAHTAYRHADAMLAAREVKA